MTPPTYIQKIEGLRGMLYRLRQVYYLSQSLLEKNSSPKNNQNIPIIVKCLSFAPLESYLIHIRALDDFIRGKKTRRDDLYAIHYLNISLHDFRNTRSSLKLKKKERKAINKQLVHITTAEPEISEWADNIPVFRDNIFKALRKFCEYPEVKEILDGKVDRWRDSDYKDVVDSLKFLSNGTKTLPYLNKGDLRDNVRNLHIDCRPYITATSTVSPDRSTNKTDVCYPISIKRDEDKKE